MSSVFRIFPIVVSIHSPNKREVLFERLVRSMPEDNHLSIQRTIGHPGNIARELDIDPGNDVIKPDIFPSGLLRMTDVLLVSAPQACFTGWVRHGDLLFTLKGARGKISHYWGRQLASDAQWISANQFDREDVSVECSFFRTGLWGTSMKSAFDYIYLRQKGKIEFFMAALGMASVKGTPEHFELKIKRIVKESVTLTGTGRDYGDLGDGIINTLTGDLEIKSGKKIIARAQGTAGLERRVPNQF